MTDGTIVRLAPTPPSISNKKFVEEVFGQDWFRAHVCSFKPDPTTLDTTGQRSLWAGGPARENFPFHADWNNFYCISVFSPDPLNGRYMRRKVAHERTYVIVIDDVGLRGLDGTSAKVPADRIKLKPTFALETSPGNWQVGYVIKDGDPRGGKVAALLDALVAAGLNQDGKDPGMKGVTRYVRLPVGRNTKAKYGTAGFDHVLGSWNPSRKYTLEEIADAYGVRAELDAAPDDLGASGAGKVDPGSDFIAKVLDEAGLIHSWDAQKSLWHVTCPFVDEHTARADSGTAYLGGGRWTCHHGHCVDRDFSDFSEKLRADFPAEWEKIVRSEFDDGLGSGEGPGPEGIAPSAMERELGEVFGDEAVEEHKVEVETRGLNSRVFSFRDALSAGPILNMPWLIKGLVPDTGIGVVYGAPGTGKSFVMLDMACRISIGEPWNGLRTKRPGMVVYVSAEGGASAMKNRMVAWAKAHTGLVPEVVVYPGSLQLGAEGDVNLPERFAKWVRKLAKKAGMEPIMVVLDTVARNMMGDENKTPDMNDFIRACDAIKEITGGFVMLVHHSGKDESKGARGNTALKAAIDVELALTREIGVGTVGRIWVSKVKEGELIGHEWGYELDPVVLGQDMDGDDVTSVVVKACPVPSTSSVAGGRGPGRSAPMRDALVETYVDMVGPGGKIDADKLAEECARRSGTKPRVFSDEVRNGEYVPPNEWRRIIKKDLVEKRGWGYLPDDGAGNKFKGTIWSREDEF